MIAATAVGATYSLGHQNSRLDVQRRGVRIMLAELPPDATILALQAPQPLVLSGKANPTRHLMFGSGLDAYLDATWPGGPAPLPCCYAVTSDPIAPDVIRAVGTAARNERERLGDLGTWMS